MMLTITTGTLPRHAQPDGLVQSSTLLIIRELIGLKMNDLQLTISTQDVINKSTQAKQI